MVCWFVFHFILVKGDWDGKEMVLLRESDGELGTLGALMALSCTSYIHKSVYVHTWPLCVTHTCPGHTGSPRQRPQSLGKPSHSKHLCLKAAQFMSCQCWGVSQKSHPVCWEMLHSPGRAGSWWCLGGLGGAHSPLQLHAEPCCPGGDPGDSSDTLGCSGAGASLTLGLCYGTQLQTGNVPFPSDEVLWKTPMRSWKEKIPQEWEWFFFCCRLLLRLNYSKLFWYVNAKFIVH